MGWLTILLFQGRFIEGLRFAQVPLFGGPFSNSMDLIMTWIKAVSQV